MSARETARGRILVRRAAKDGEQGIPGLIYRTSRWEIGKEYRNDTDLTSTADGFRYVDVVTDVDMAVVGVDTFNAYICKRTHTSSVNNPLVEGANWTKMNSLKPIATSLILASKILADYINVGDLAADNAFLTALTAESAFINKLIANTAFLQDLAAASAFINALTVKSLQTDSGKVKIENTGSINAVEGTFSKASIDKGVIQDVTVKGSLSSPLELWRNYDMVIDTYPGRKYHRYPSSDANGRYCWMSYYKYSASATYISSDTVFTADEIPDEGDNVYSYSSGSGTRGAVESITAVNVFNGNADGSDRHDNVVLPQRPASSAYQTITSEQFTWDASNIGRFIRLVNYKWSDTEPDGYITLQAPSDKYFYESGYERSSIRLSREYVELFGYGADGVFYGWIVTNRQDVKTRGEYGMPWKVIYQGCVNPYAAVPLERIWSCDLDISGTSESTWEYQQLDTGHYRIYLPKRIVKYNPVGQDDYYNCWHVVLTPRSCAVNGDAISGCTEAGYACLTKKGYEYSIEHSIYRSYFEVKTADDASLNDLPFDFYVISMANWVNPSVNQ